jgi:SAM-dependent methyltransferase
VSEDRSAAAVCPFCAGAGAHVLTARDRNRETTAQRFGYARCRTCGTVFIVRAPADLARFYAGDYYGFDPDGEPTWKRDERQRAAAAYRVGLLASHAAPGHLIEIGAGTGAFAVSARAAGFEVSAIEMSERCCRYLSEREGIRAICSDRPLQALAALPASRAIALWHVLEHLPDPAALLELAAERLQPGGLLALAVPNPRSLQFRLLGARWAHLDAPRHLCLIPPPALVDRGERLGLRTVALTASDPDGIECNLFGWVNSLRVRPAAGPPSTAAIRAAGALARVLAPLERSSGRGAAVTVLMQRGSSPGAAAADGGATGARGAPDR